MSVLLLLASTSQAAAPADVAVYEAVDKLYGKPIPEAAVCIVRPTLPPPIGSPIPVGVRRGARGCVLVGVMHDDDLLEPEAALAAIVGAEAWSALEAERRQALLSAWTTDVLLAFGQLDGEPAVEARDGQWIVRTSYRHRTDDSDVAGRSEGTFTFDAAGVLTAEDATLKDRWRTTFFVRPDSVEGVSTDTVLKALQSKGRTLKQCFTDEWEHDLELQGRVRLAWTLKDGKAEQMAVVAGDEHPEDLARCYARVVRSVPFPEEATGQVRWSFSAVKAPAE